MFRGALRCSPQGILGFILNCVSEYNLTGKGYQQYQVMFIILVMAQGLDLNLSSLESWPPSKSLQIINAGEGVEKGESFYVVLVGKQTGVATMKNSSSKK